jgi:uncharacterized protein (TIGR02246 family)
LHTRHRPRAASRRARALRAPPRGLERDDADAFAAAFAPDGVSIGFDGSTAKGDEIREHIGAVFADHQTAAYVAKVREVRPLGADAVLLRAIVGMVPSGGDAVNSNATLVAVRDGDGTGG